MEQQIQDLIASIKKEGIESATNESKKILEEARKEAERIVSDAKIEKEKILSDAKKSIALEKESSVSSIKQAARDVSLTIKKSLETKFQKILNEKVSSALDENVMKDVLVTVLKGEFSSSVVELPSDKVEEVRALLSSELSKEMMDGIELRPSLLVGNGFRVYNKDGGAYIDLSDEECTKLLYPYLSSSLKDLF